MLQHLALCTCIGTSSLKLFIHTNECIRTPDTPVEKGIRIRANPAKIDTAKSYTSTITIITPYVRWLK
jgi:hypothetical protein